jgi:hypothetical protein
MTQGSLNTGRPFYKKKEKLINKKEQHERRFRKHLHPSRAEPEYGMSDNTQTV